MQIILRYIYYFMELITQSIWVKSRSHSRIDGVVLMYHHLSDRHIDGVIDSCQHTTDEFLHSLNRIEQAGYSFVSLADSIKLMDNSSNKKFAVITFDDVPSSMYEVAYPILRDRQIPFTLFITTDFIGEQGYLSKDQIVELSNNSLCTIGAHSKTHPFLSKSNDLYTELLTSKDTLSKLIGKEVNFMAYPYGKYSSVSRCVRKSVKSTGYICAFGTINAPITDLSYRSRYFLPRIVLK